MAGGTGSLAGTYSGTVKQGVSVRYFRTHWRYCCAVIGRGDGAALWFISFDILCGGDSGGLVFHKTDIACQRGEDAVLLLCFRHAIMPRH